MIGLDSISRNMFERKLPKSLKVLQELFHAHVLEGYNIVGDGTPQALIPMLTGKFFIYFIPDQTENEKAVDSANLRMTLFYGFTGGLLAFLFPPSPKKSAFYFIFIFFND